MAENYDDISCEDVIYSEDYRDYIKEYFQVLRARIIRSALRLSAAGMR
mgnify:FL=1